MTCLTWGVDRLPHVEQVGGSQRLQAGIAKNASERFERLWRSVRAAQKPSRWTISAHSSARSLASVAASGVHALAIA
jgi:hypothetical protein